MSDYELTKESPLGGAEHEFDGVTVAEVIDQSLVMVALPRDRAEDIESAIARVLWFVYTSDGSVN